VQVASHRRQVDALTEFANLRRRSPRLLQGFQPLIQRADLPGKGTYYRLRIGPLASKGDAVRFCQALKAAGKSGCLIRRR
jgi:cell division protein FtsN